MWRGTPWRSMERKDNDKIYLQHILDSIESVERYIEGFSEEEFSRLEEKQDAVIRKLEIIGEAGSKLSKELRDKYKNIEWEKMISMRNFLIHEYFGVDMSQVWKTATKDIPALKEGIRKILKEFDRS